ncbi:hypothetical protein V6N12_051237 [Hibiscus sabdariffa]|uniref:Uncharacterized protein n=1 Tax=Hibiscus sabdariffa TaxID=183260 RepID=A0ABR2GER2_9ROSI
MQSSKHDLSEISVLIWGQSLFLGVYQLASFVLFQDWGTKLLTLSQSLIYHPRLNGFGLMMFLHMLFPGWTPIVDGVFCCDCVHRFRRRAYDPWIALVILIMMLVFSCCFLHRSVF